MVQVKLNLMNITKTELKTTHELQHNKCITDVVMKRLSEKAREISKLYDTETGDIKDGLSILRILACLLQHQKTT